MERRPWFEPLAQAKSGSEHHRWLDEIVSFYGITGGGDAITSSSSSSSSCDASSVIPLLATCAFHQRVSTVFLMTRAQLLLQRHKGCHIATAGMPFVRRMGDECHWWPKTAAKNEENGATADVDTQQEPAAPSKPPSSKQGCRPCHESANLLGRVATKRRLWFSTASSLEGEATGGGAWAQLLNERTLDVRTLRALAEAGAVVGLDRLDGALATPGSDEHLDFLAGGVLVTSFSPQSSPTPPASGMSKTTRLQDQGSWLAGLLDKNGLMLLATGDVLQRHLDRTLRVMSP